jgi:hypothetical protein
MDICGGKSGEGDYKDFGIYIFPFFKLHGEEIHIGAYLHVKK